MKLDNIWVSQNGLRNIEQLSGMIEYVKNGHIFTLSAINAHILLHTNKHKLDGLIELAEFEDGRVVIHNGHHRVAAIYLGRKSKEVYNTEYIIKKWKYKDYNEVNLPLWTTPFDIVSEVRVSNLKDWKHFIGHYYKVHGEEKTIDYIFKHKSMFCSKRNCYHIKDIINA